MVLSATELRIGNYVEYKNNIVKFAIGDFTEADNNSQFLELFINPIPLTEQWLKDFGFIDDGRFKWNGWYWIGDFGIAHEPDQDCWVWQVVDEGSVEMPDFKYVHQLQNLYFILTGKELTK